MNQPIQVSYQTPRTIYEINQLLQSLPDLIACDFEVATKLTLEERTQLEEQLNEPTISKRQRITIQSQLRATALDHPSYCYITHFSVAWSESDAATIILDTPEKARLVLKFLITTTKKQVWHNAAFDFRYIYYHTNQFPKDYEDTQIRSKCILNHVNPDQALTGLKHLAGSAYGDWGLSSDYFSLSEMYNEKILYYAAVDACATYWLWNKIEDHLREA